MMEGPMPTRPQGPKKLKSSLETILEVSSRRERARTESNAEPEFNSQASWEATFLEEIPAADEEIASSLWREVRGKTDKARSGIGLPPFSFMSANQPLEDQWAADSLNQRTATRSLGWNPMIENEVKNNFPKEQETGEDLEEVIAEQALSTLVPCTLPLKDLL